MDPDSASQQVRVSDARPGTKAVRNAANPPLSPAPLDGPLED